ncbi:MAG: ATP-binding protein, partial [Sphaerochaetaceae bacterium]|nr:ATP-binding protein [Sphaerochaetaceae bacterium]
SGYKFAYVNFDDERLKGLQAEDLNAVLECLYKIYGNFEYLFLDEVQNVDEWYLFINRLLRQGIKILLTGSNAKLLSGELATHLTGRYIQTELYPFSFKEFCSYKKIELDISTTKNRGLLQAAFDDYLNNGGFPELLVETRKQTYINTLINNILINDIEKRYSIRYKSAFEQIAEHLLNNSPAKINYSDIQATFGLKSDHTAENYIQYLKNAYIIQGLHKYSAKSKIRIRAEKTYATDISMMNNRENAFSGENLGWRLETLIYIELLRRNRPLENDVYYYEETAGECDFVVCRGKSVHQLIQVSWDIENPKTFNREIRGLKIASKATGCKNLLLITYNKEDTLTTNEGLSVNIQPAYKWLVNSSL